MNAPRVGSIVGGALALALAALVLACRAQPAAAPRSSDPVALVSPDTGPSALQQHLAALAPAPTAAGSEALGQRIAAFFARAHSRRGYLAVDKPLYQPGETLWFRLFELASADFAGAGDPEIATVQLISPRGSVVAARRIAVDHGAAGNDVELGGDLPGGEYRLTAETSLGTRVERRVIVAAYEAPRLKKQLELTRKAYGPGDPVTATVAVHRATGEPLAHHLLIGAVSLDGADLARVPVTTDAEGNARVSFALPAAIQRGDGLITVLVDDGGVTESVQKRIPITLHELQLALYPEGGDLVAGLPARVYFAARTLLDKPADIEGRVVDDRGRLAAVLRSFHDGMGRFELSPEAGRRYHVEITRPAGIARTFELPAARPAGCTMQALDDYASARPDLRVALWCSEAREVTLAAVLRERRITTVTATVSGPEGTVVALAMPPGVQGAVRVTAFDDRLAPLAERLIYRGRGADLTITLTPDRAAYHPRDAVTLAVQTRGPDGAPVAADLAISAVDDSVLAFADDKQATLLARMYLEAELPGDKPGHTIEEPNFYFSADKQAPAALDLVLGTQGWRRFDWKPVLAAPLAPPIRAPWRFAGAYGTPPDHRDSDRAMRHRVRHGIGRRGEAAPEEVDRDADGLPDTDDLDDADDGPARKLREASERRPRRLADADGKAAPVKPAKHRLAGAADDDNEAPRVRHAKPRLGAAAADGDNEAPRVRHAKRGLAGAAAADDDDEALRVRHAKRGLAGAAAADDDDEALRVRHAKRGLAGPDAGLHMKAPHRPAGPAAEAAKPAPARPVRAEDDDEAEEAPRAFHGRALAVAAPDDHEELLEIEAPVRRRFAIGGEAAPRRHAIRRFERAAPAADDVDDEDALCCTVVERQFPEPRYAGRYDGPRTDFRDTVAWRSRLRTDAAGKGELRFSLSDAVTSFRVIAEGVGGGRLGRGEALVSSRKPVSLAATLPLEVSIGDHVRLPVTVANETDQPYRAALGAAFGKAFAVRGGGATPELVLAPRERRAVFYELDVVGGGGAGDGKIALGVAAANLRDDVERTVRIVPPGFPQLASLAGTLTSTAHHEVVIGDAVPGTLRGTLTLYPSPLATMMRGTEAMIAEPGGCFEQASSTNYPNIMILGYLEEHRAASPEIVERAHTALDHGYKLLTGYEAPTRGYEWFGADPGHEALTAYGLLEFHDMTRVYGDVDRTMIDRTRDWLRTRRDGRGGFLRNPRHLDGFGGASAEVTDAYITYALSEAGERDLGPEIERQRRSAAATRDPYLLGLAASVLVAQALRDDATRAAVARLAGLQASDGSFPGADHSITRSGGEALAIETTALAALALIAAGPERAPEVRKAIAWLDQHRNGFGGYGSTQSTVLALKAMAAYAKSSRQTQAGGTITLVVNGTQVGKLAYDKGHQGPLELPIAQHLVPGKNVIDITLASTEPLPYSARIEWSSRQPQSDPATAVRITTRLARPTVRLGETDHLDVAVENATDRGVPMTLARVGLPGGMTFQTWQLQELRDNHLVDFYETRPREVILYFRSLGSGAVREVPLELMATVPGQYTSPASRAYLYYTSEHKHWVAPSTVTIAP